MGGIAYADRRCVRLQDVVLGKRVRPNSWNGQIVKGSIVHPVSTPVEAATVEVRMRRMHRASLAGIMGKVERVDSRRASRAGKEESRCPLTWSW